MTQTERYMSASLSNDIGKRFNTKSNTLVSKVVEEKTQNTILILQTSTAIRPATWSKSLCPLEVILLPL